MLRVLNVFLVGLLAGAMFEEFFVFAVILDRLPAAVWATLHARFGLVHPFTIIPIAVGATVTLGLVVARERRTAAGIAPSTWLGAASAVLVILLTGAVMVPYNLEIESWTRTGAPDDWEAVRSRWAALQGTRAALCVTAFAALLRGATRRSADRGGAGT